MVIQSALLVDVQLQDSPAVTLTLAVPPEALSLILDGAMEEGHPFWVTVTVFPAMVIVPVLATQSGLAKTEY